MMRKKISKILGLFFIAVVLFAHGQRAIAAPSHTIHSKAENAFYSSDDVLPNAELEGLHFPAAAAHIVVQKTTVPYFLLLADSGETHYFSVINFQIKESTLLLKDYLFFIYPSHHFW